MCTVSPFSYRPRGMLLGWPCLASFGQLMTLDVQLLTSCSNKTVSVNYVQNPGLCRVSLRGATRKCIGVVYAG